MNEFFDYEELEKQYQYYNDKKEELVGLLTAIDNIKKNITDIMHFNSEIKRQYVYYSKLFKKYNESFDYIDKILYNISNLMISVKEKDSHITSDDKIDKKQLKKMLFE